MGLTDDVTLIIPARGRPEGTLRLLSSLVTSRAGYEVILVDDASNPPLEELLSNTLGLRLRYVRNDVPAGPAACRNVGIRLAKTAFVAFTDNDVAVTEGWMAHLYCHLREAPLDVAGVGGRVLDDGTTLVGRYATRHRLLDPFVYRGRVLYLVTANCLIRKSDLDLVGGFDEKFHAPGGEDVDVSFRMLGLGRRLEYAAEAVVYHSYAKSWLAFWRTFVRYGKGCRMAMETLARMSCR
jgi:GT2 family glycosyltransferase